MPNLEANIDNRKKASTKKWKDANREYLAQKKREWYLAHQETEKAKARKWAKDHPEINRARASAAYHKRVASPEHKAKIAARETAKHKAKEDRQERRRQYEIDNADFLRERKRLWREIHIEEMRLKSRQWARDNPDKTRASNAARRAKYRGSYSPDDLVRIMALQKGKCAACKVILVGRAYHVDHVMPIARDGANSPDNLQLLCGPCNLKKHDRDPFEWARSLGRLFV